MIREAQYYLRMTRGVHKMARGRLEPDPASVILKTLEARASNFLHVMRRVIFDDPSNPYHALFSWAGCGYEDLEREVARDGLEPTLDALRRAGVYVSHDEFKGKRPIERNGRTLPVQTHQFANPLVTGLLETTSGGTRSSGTISRRSLEYQMYREAQTYTFCDQFGLSKRPIVGIRSILPSDGGMRLAITFARRGLAYEKWFAIGSFRGSGHYRMVTKFLLMEARLLGIPLLFPDYLPLNDFTPVARWIADRKKTSGSPILWSSASLAVRVAAAAKDLGLDIAGTTCLVGSESLTQAKRDVIASAGAEVFNRYGVSELGQIGISCPGMKDDAVHVCLDSVAVISYRRLAPLTEVEIDSLMFTSLLPTAAFVLVNVEMDDSGILEPAQCDCGLKAAGFHQQLRSIYSYGRLTGQGMTLVGGDMLRILEHSLPQRFGGVNTDYQLVECEGKDQTEMELRVHPRVGAVSPEEVRKFFFEELKRLWGGALTHRNWSQTNGVRVVIGEPHMSGKQRIHPLHLLGTTKRQREEKVQ